MDRRQNGGARRKIVQDFVTKLTDDKERMFCYLAMRNYSDAEIKHEMKLNQTQLDLLKLQIAIKLKNSGIQEY